MKLATYVARRIALFFPTIIGVMTITFVLLAALPVQDQLIARFGFPPRQDPCGYAKSCPCSVLDRNPKLTGTCNNPLFTRLTNKLHLNRPYEVQWAFYMENTFTFQWGTVSNNSEVAQTYAFSKGEPVSKFLGQMMPYTLELAILSLAIILLVAIPLGNLSAVNRNRPIDQASRVVSFSGFAIPPFLLGSLVVFGAFYLLLPHTGYLVTSPWCPTGEPLQNEIWKSWPSAGCYGNNVEVATLCPSWLSGCLLSHPTGFPTIDAVLHGYYWVAADTLLRMILPALVIAYGAIAGLLRFVRNSMLEVMNLDYVRTARAKGVPEREVVNRHAGRNSLNVTVTVLGLTFAFFLGGFPVIEDVFQLEGIGRALALAVIPGYFDFGVIFGSTILFTYLVVAANIIVDVLYAYLDPRVRLG